MLAELNKKITIGYFWSLLTKWLNRSIGLVSTLCLVRILSPEDFGIVALATIIQAFFVMISDAGTGKYLIKEQKLTNEMLNSAWSLNIALKILCCLIIAIFAKPLTYYMNNSELYNVLLIFCLIPFINAFKNIGLVLYEKELNFKPLTKLSVTVKVIVLPVTLFFAFLMQNYWALIIGLLVNEILTVVGSYIIHQYRPKWSRTKWKEQWSFSKWHLLSMTSGYVRSRIDAFLIGRYLSNNAVGLYRIGQEFAWLPFTELIAPATNSLYSGISQLIHHKEECHKSIIKYLILSYLLVVPSVASIYTFNELFTSVILGEKWMEAAPIIGLLSILMLSMPLNICLQSILTNLSKVRYLIYIDIIMVFSIIGIILGLLGKADFYLMEYLEYRIFLVFIFIFSLCFLYKKFIGLSVLKILLTLVFPIIPSITTVILVKEIENHSPLPDILTLGLLFVSGVFIYSVLVIITIMIAKNKFKEYVFIINSLKRIKLLTQNG